MKWTIPERIIQRGRKYADEGRVVKITQDMVQELWHAEVIGSKIYDVTLDGSPLEEDLCTCPYWQDKGFCKHTVAVELALRDKGLKRVLKQNPQLKTTYQAPSTATVFTDSFAKLQQAVTTQALQASQPLQVEFLLTSVPLSKFHLSKALFGLSFKIGRAGSRTYVVKNAADFLRAVDSAGAYEINRETTVTLNEASFSKTDWDLLQDSLVIWRSNQLLLESGVPAKGTLNQRYLILSQVVTQSWLQKLSSLGRLQLEVEDKKVERIFFATGVLPLRIDVLPVSQGYHLAIRDHSEMFWENYHWVLRGSTMYQLSAEQQVIYQNLLQLLKRLEQPVIFYPEEQVGDLFAYVLPMLGQIATLQIADSLQNELIHLPLVTEMTLAVEAEVLQARVDFKYGEEVFSTDAAFNTTTEKTAFVVRNHVQEQRVAALFEHYGYLLRERAYMKKLPEKAGLYELFAREIPTLRKFAQVTVADSLQRLYLTGASFQPQVEIVPSGSWLDIRFDVSQIAETDIADVMLHLANQEEFYQLPSGEILAFDGEGFQQTSEALSQIREQLIVKDGHFLVPQFRGLQVEEAFGPLTGATTNQSFTKLVQALTDPESRETPVPDNLETTLRPYQVDGFRWLKMLSHYGFGGILADDMGLGKTVQGITYLLSEKNDGQSMPSLVVAPASVIYNWQQECQKFAPSLVTCVVSGNSAEREKLLSEYEGVDVFITSYATLRQDIELYQQIPLNCLILDEAQMIKNSATKTFQALKELKTQQRFAFSGTPVENNLDELWSIFYMLMPGFFPSKGKFRQLTTEEIAKMIQPFVLRREKKTVLQDLPDKLEANLYSPLSEEQKVIYLAQLQQMQASVGQMSSANFKQNRISILAGLTRLRQICCDPRLFIDDYAGDSGKLEQVKELVRGAKASGRRILLFSQFTSMLSLIEEELAPLGVTTFYLRGSTPPQDRVSMVEAFNRGERDVFLISLKAGGTGLNLTGADTVILYDLWWNPAVEEQAAGRAHRIGQKKVVEVWRLIAEGTIEEKMNQLQETKRDLFNQVMNGAEEQQLAQLTEEDIREILSLGEA